MMKYARSSSYMTTDVFDSEFDKEPIEDSYKDSRKDTVIKSSTDVIRELYESCDDIVVILDLIHVNSLIFQNSQVFRNSVCHSFVHIVELLKLVKSDIFPREHYDDPTIYKMNPEDRETVQSAICFDEKMYKKFRKVRNRISHMPNNDYLSDILWKFILAEIPGLYALLRDEYRKLPIKDKRKHLVIHDVK